MSKFISSIALTTLTGVTINGSNLPLVVSGTLSSAQLLSLSNTVSIELIPAQGANKVIAIDKIILSYNFVTTPYTSGSSVTILYNNASATPAWLASGSAGGISMNIFISSISNFSNYMGGYTQVNNTANIENKNVTIGFGGATGLTLGDGTLDYTIYYSVIDV